MRDFSTDQRWLSINTATVRAQWPLDRIVDECARRGIRAISPWRDQVAAVGLDKIAKAVRDHGLELSGYCRGGMGLAEPVDEIITSAGTRQQIIRGLAHRPELFLLALFDKRHANLALARFQMMEVERQLT